MANPYTTHRVYPCVRMCRRSCWYRYIQRGYYCSCDQGTLTVFHIQRVRNHSMGLCDRISGAHTHLLTTPAPRSIIARTNVAFVNSSYTCSVCVGWNHNQNTRSQLQHAAMCRELTVHQRESNSQSFDQEPNYTTLHHQPPLFYKAINL